MRKIDSLLEKAKLFEKLATNKGDRKSFLKALALEQSTQNQSFQPLGTSGVDLSPREDVSYPVDTNTVRTTGSAEEQLNQKFREIAGDLKAAGVQLPEIDLNPTHASLEKEVKKLIIFLRESDSVKDLTSKEDQIKELYDVYNKLQELPKSSPAKEPSKSSPSAAGKDLETLNNMKFWVEKLRGLHDVTDRAKMEKIIRDISVVLNRMKASYPKQVGELQNAVEGQKRRIGLDIVRKSPF